MPRKIPDGYAGDTAVPIERSKAEIERLLQKHGAAGYHSGWQAPTADLPGWDAVEFLWRKHTIRFRIERPSLTVVQQKAGKVLNVQAYADQIGRQRWRLLLLVIKAKLEAVEAGVVVFEEEFMAHIVTHSNKTVGEILLPRLLAADGRIALPEGRG